MHVEEVIRGAFEATVMEHGGEAAWWLPPDTPIEFGDVPDAEEPVSWITLLSWLRDCTDTLPADLCEELGLPQGSAYSEVFWSY